MSNGRRFKRSILQHRAVIKYDVVIPKERRQEPGHLITLEKNGPDIMEIRCSCGVSWSGPMKDKDSLERQAYEHFLPLKGTQDEQI